MNILNYLKGEWDTLINAPLLSFVLIFIGFLLGRLFYRERIKLLEKSANINEVVQLKKELKSKNKEIKELEKLNRENFGKIIKDLTNSNIKNT